MFSIVVPTDVINQNIKVHRKKFEKGTPIVFYETSANFVRTLGTLGNTCY